MDHRKFLILLFSLFFCGSQNVLAEEEVTSDETVVALTDSTFDEYTKGNPLVLVEFYAPWCGHCKNLAPAYEQAAKELLENDPPVKLVKVDATVEKTLASRFEVSGYPTLKFIKNGETLDFDGPRDAEGIVSRVKALADPNYKPPPEAVVTLNSAEEFESFTKSAELTLVEFYAPWCGHCKKLAPEYEKAAKRLLDHEPPIKLAKMDATVHKEVADKMGISGFPTLFIYRSKADANGEVKASSYAYDGPREEDGIVEYMIKQSGDAAKLVKSLKELKAQQQLDDIVVVGLFKSVESQAYQQFQTAVNSVRDKYSLFYATDADIRARYGAAEGDMMAVILPEVMVTKYDKAFYTLPLTDNTNPTEVLGFIAGHEVPLVGTRTPKNKDRYTRRPLCVLYVPVDWSHEYREMTASWRDKLLTIANKWRKDFNFAMSDDEEHSAELKSFGFEDSGSDFSLGCFGTSGEKFPLPELDEWDSDEINDFLKKVKGGKAKAYLKSQIPPKVQTKPVLTVTGKTFKDIVLDTNKDVLIEMYAPWCGHCKKFEPEYKKLAEQLASETTLVIAKMNADANDAPDGYEVQGYPTIYFAPANRKEKPVKYEGNRDLEDLKKFLRENSHLSFKGSKDEL